MLIGEAVPDQCNREHDNHGDDAGRAQPASAAQHIIALLTRCDSRRCLGEDGIALHLLDHDVESSKDYLPCLLEDQVARRKIERSVEEITHAPLRIDDLDEVADPRGERSAPRNPRLHPDAPHEPIERIIIGEGVKQRSLEPSDQINGQ